MIQLNFFSTAAVRKFPLLVLIFVLAQTREVIKHAIEAIEAIDAIDAIIK